MERPLSDNTNVSLLARVSQNPVDQAAWDAFVGIYEPRIRGWCRKRGLQPADAEDVTQNVLLRMASALRTFSYDPSRRFRGWLRLVTEHALSDYFAERKRRRAAGSGSGDDLALAALDNAPAREDLLVLLKEEFRRAVLTQACESARSRVEPQTWRAFELTACENRPGEEVATSLGMTVTAVFKAKSRVLTFVREEFHRLNAQT
jgi:RNA polymerase sigma factor (sigma-70 family)